MCVRVRALARMSGPPIVDDVLSFLSLCWSLSSHTVGHDHVFVASTHTCPLQDSLCHSRLSCFLSKIHVVPPKDVEKKEHFAAALPI